MSLIRVGVAAFPIVPNPPSGKFYIGLDSNNGNHLTRQDSAGVLTDYEAAATLNINGLTEAFRTNSDILVPFYDPVLLANRKVQAREFLYPNADLVEAKFSDFIGDVAGQLTASVAGSGASNQLGTYGFDGAQKCRGISQLDTGTVTTGRAALTCPGQSQLFLESGDIYKNAWRAAIESLSTGAEGFTVYIGFGNMFASGGLTGQFIGFRYNDAINAGNWQALLVVGGVIIDAADTGVPGDLDYHVFDVELTATNARFAIDGAVVHNFTSGLPSSSAQPFSFGAKIEKSIGTTQRNLSLDWYSFGYFRSSAR